jgi:ferric-dicitrate binding protein FerR (iron transport regulator)
VNDPHIPFIPREPAPRRPTHRDQLTAVAMYASMAAFLVAFWWIVGSLIVMAVWR